MLQLYEAQRNPSSQAAPVYEDLVLREGEGLKCEEWRNPYRSDGFELSFDNASKTYKVSVPSVRDEQVRLQALKRFEGRQLWCAFKDTYVFSCTTQDLRKSAASLDRAAETFSVKRRIQHFLEPNRAGAVVVRTVDYLDVEISGEGDLSSNLPYSFFQTASCKPKKRWF